METETLQEKRIKTEPKLRFKEFNGNWKKKSLSTSAKIITGSTPATNVGEFYGGQRLFISPADITNTRFVTQTKTTLTETGFSKGRKINQKSVLFVSIGSTIGKVGQAGEECITNQQINALEANKENSNDFIFSLLEKNGSKIKLLAGTQAVPLINKTDFSNLKFYFPSLSEQQKIASFLSAVDKKIQQLTRKKELLETYKKGVMQKLFSQEIRFKDVDGKDFPEWKPKMLKNICSFFSGGTPTSTNKEYYSGSIPFIGSGNINDSSVTNFITEEAYNSSSAKRVEVGDILYALYGANSGEVAISKMAGAINQAILCIRTTFNTSYLYYLLSFNQEKIITKYLQGGQGNLSANIIKNLTYEFPIEEEQQKIADFLSAIDKKIEAVSQQIEKTKTFKKGLLQQMFV